MLNKIYVLFLLPFFLTPALLAQPESPDPLRFREEINAFKEWDRKNSYPPNAILFVGSSSIRLWETATAFPELPVINRGFGGAVISDVQYYYEETIDKYDPKIIVFYTGDNDIAIGMSPEEVFADYKTIVQTILDDHPDVSFVYLPIKPSSSRWKLWEQMQEVNRRVRKYNEQHGQLHYIDLATPLLTRDGRPDDSLFLDDQLHLGKKGYALWNRLLGKELERLF